jgi:hypothetical protein
MILTVSPMLQSFSSSCATNLDVFFTNFPYFGCFTLRSTETTIDLSILSLVTIPIRSFLKLRFSISSQFQINQAYACASRLESSVLRRAIVLRTVRISNGFSIGETLCASFIFVKDSFELAIESLRSCTAMLVISFCFITQYYFPGTT